MHDIEILVVEDEPLLLILAMDVVETIRVLEAVPDIRVLWTDIDMPGLMNGLCLAAMVRDRWPPVEIIVVSGKTIPKSTELPERGVFFGKPYDTRRIVDTLHKMAA